MNNSESKKHNTTGSSQQVTMLTVCCWQLSLAALWPSCSLRDEERSATIQLLKQRLLNSTDIHKTYLEICQRILLTREQLISNPGYRISNLPTRFFNSREKGFRLSETWYNELLLKRRDSISYKLPLRGLAEAILDMAEEPFYTNFNYWLAWFIEQEAYDEQLLFIVVSAFQQFKTGIHE